MIVGAIFGVLLGVGLMLQRKHYESAITMAEDARDLADNDYLVAVEERDAARAQRDTALTERNTAITAVRYIRMTSREIGALAKSKCKDCFGAGTLPRNGGLIVCECTKTAIRSDLKYGISPEGEPVRLATREELVAMGHTPIEDVFSVSTTTTEPPKLSLVGTGR